MTRFLVLLLAPFLALALPAGAQVVAPVAGEHADFTRIVLRLAPGVGWALSPDGRERRLVLDPEGARFDLSQLFRRIPRDRLSAARAEGPVLTLTLACDCPVRAWEDRPGLVILDITDAPPGAAPPAPPPPPTLPAARPQPLPDPIANARAAGLALARATPPPAAAPPTPPPVDDPRLATLAQDLGRAIAAATGQGLLQPAADVAAPDPDPGLLAGAPMPDLPANMRVATVLDRPDPTAPPPAPPPAACAGSDILDRLLTHESAGFTAALGRLTGMLYGEFDQPDAEAQRALLGLYLSVGFGAEARALIANSPDPVAGRDLVLGMADVLEGRASNSRMRLAQAIDCGGAAAVLAALAGAEAEGLRRHADALALRFAEFPAALRSQLGGDLAAALAQAGALDAARTVAESTARSPWTTPGSLALLEARLDRARGHPADAAARLAHEGDATTATVQTRLDLALQTRGAIDPGYVAGAEALAASARDGATGAELMASVIRLYARSGALTDAFAALDRLETWMSATGENRRLLGALRDEVWAAMASNGTDFGLVEAVLAREDWRDEALQPQTRRALAARLLDLGLAAPVDRLLAALDDAPSRVLQARAALVAGDARAALSLLGDDPGEAARRTRAQALEALGDHAAAGAEFATLGNTEGEARAAILGADWRRVEGLAAAHAAPEPAAELGPLLGRAPGHAEMALTQPVAPGDSAAPPPAATPDSPEVPGPGGRAAPTAPPAPGPEPGSPPGPAAAAEAPPGAVVPARVPAPALAQAPPDPGAAFDRLGLVHRSSTLLAESERLRAALAPLVEARP